MCCVLQKGKEKSRAPNLVSCFWAPGRNPAQRLRLGDEAQQNERWMISSQNRPKRCDACDESGAGDGGCDSLRSLHALRHAARPSPSLGLAGHRGSNRAPSFYAPDGAGWRQAGLVLRKKKAGHQTWCPAISGAGDGARTRYLHLGKVALYQMSYAREQDVL